MSDALRWLLGHDFGVTRVTPAWTLREGNCGWEGCHHCWVGMDSYHVYPVGPVAPLFRVSYEVRGSPKAEVLGEFPDAEEAKRWVELEMLNLPPPAGLHVDADAWHADREPAPNDDRDRGFKVGSVWKHGRGIWVCDSAAHRRAAWRRL